jgi:hypothetical protein
MIADKIFPSFYTLKLSGEAVQALIPGDFGIDRIAIGSRDFTTDLMATDALQQAIKFISAAPNIDITDIVEKVEFNPEFFPSVVPPELTEEQKEEILQAQEIIDEMEERPGQQAVVLTRMFDPLGDFIESRWSVESPKMVIEGKVGINPEKYMDQKGQEIFNKKNLIVQPPSTPPMH